MDFLNMETLPRFQERLDLAASELTDLEEIFCKAINELAGRLHIINNLLPAEERINKATEQNYKIVDTIYKAQESYMIKHQSYLTLYKVLLHIWMRDT